MENNYKSKKHAFRNVPQPTDTPDFMLACLADAVMKNAESFWRGIKNEEDYKRDLVRLLCNVYWVGKVGGINFAAGQTREKDTKEFLFKEIDRILGRSDNSERINMTLEELDKIAEELEKINKENIDGNR